MQSAAIYSAPPVTWRNFTLFFVDDDNMTTEFGRKRTFHSITQRNFETYTVKQDHQIFHDKLHVSKISCILIV
jgi:hypothetical protein